MDTDSVNRTGWVVAAFFAALLLTAIAERFNEDRHDRLEVECRLCSLECE